MNELEHTYRLCQSTGNIREKRTDIELIKSILDVAKRGLEFIGKVNIKKDSTDWTFVFREHYESLRGLIEAYILFDGIEAENHQCKNAYVCHKHPELKLDWQFLETIRLRRNAINYRGQLLGYDDWKLFELNFRLHINILEREIERKIHNL